MNKTKENDVDLSNANLEVFLKDERTQFDDNIWKFEMGCNVEDFNDFIKDVWFVVGEQKAKNNGTYCFESVVQSCFQGLAKLLDVDNCIVIKQKTQDGKVIKHGE